jgi:hypothetical protein
VGRSSDSIYVLTLVLIALLAWPWSVLLSAAEASRVCAWGPRHRAPEPETFGTRHLMREGPAGSANGSMSVPDFARDEDEEDDDKKGDEGRPLSLSWEFSPLGDVGRYTASASPDLSIVHSPRAIPRKPPCRFRC